MNFISLYGLFFAKIVTLFFLCGLFFIVIMSLGLRRSGSGSSKLCIINLGKKYRETEQEMQKACEPEKDKKSCWQIFKKKDKADLLTVPQKLAEAKPHLYVLDFKGSIDAREVASLREEISAVLAVATTDDEILLRLESPGGVVHGYGLAAAQLMRITAKGIRLTVAVDKIAASGGYMMACVAQHIISAPFAIIGSIGVVAQLPNFHRLLQKNDIDVELHTAGEFKRTLTLFGENTVAGREKFCQELNEAHHLFKTFVQQQRPILEIDAVATGEHWFGLQALEKRLVDKISTSDDFIIEKIKEREIISVRYIQHRPLIARFTSSIAKSIHRLLLHWWQCAQKPLL